MGASALAGLGMNVANQAAGGAMGLLLAKYNDKRQLKQQSKLQEMQEQGNMRMMDYSQEKSYDMWQKTGPVGQMEQLKKAGLNPALMYEGGGAGGQSITPSGNVSGGQAPSGGGEVQQMMGMMLQNKMMQAQIKVAESQANKNNVEATKIGGADTKLTEAQALTEKGKQGLQEIENLRNGISLQIETNTKQNVVREIEAKSDQAQEVLEQLRRNNDIGEETYKDQVEIIQQEAIGASLKNSLTRANISLTEEQTKVASEQIKALVQQIIASKENVRQRWSEIGIDYLWKEHRKEIENISDATRLEISAIGGIIQSAVGKGRGTTTTVTDGWSESKGEYSEVRRVKHD